MGSIPGLDCRQLGSFSLKKSHIQCTEIQCI